MLSLLVMFVNGRLTKFKNQNIINVEDSINKTKCATKPRVPITDYWNVSSTKIEISIRDNIDSGNLETPNAFHSPILGYAYDGNPCIPIWISERSWWCY